MTQSEAVDLVLRDAPYLRKHFAEGDEGVPSWIAGAALVHLRCADPRAVLSVVELRLIALQKLRES